MKKLVLFLLVLFAVVGLQACGQDETVDETFNAYVVSEFALEIEEISEGIQLEKDRSVVYLYKEVIGQDTNGKDIYNVVASSLVYEIGDIVNVVNIQLDNFDYNVIQFEDGTLDTSWHEYLEVI